MWKQTKSTSKSFSENVDEYANKQILSHYSTKDKIILSFCMYQLLHPDKLIDQIQMKHLSVFHISKIKFYLGLGLNRIFLFKMVVTLMAFNFFGLNPFINCYLIVFYSYNLSYLWFTPWFVRMHHILIYTIHLQEVKIKPGLKI